MTPGRIAVYAPTGRLGRMVTKELVARGATVRLGGRNKDKLAEVATQIAAGADWRVAAAEDAAALREWLDGCRVIVNAAGGLSEIGERLIAAAFDAGVHYIDAAGEQSHVRCIFEQHGSAAEQRGIALVPAFGFDYALGDCLAYLTARDLQPADEVIVAYAIDGPDVQGNSLQFAAERPGGGEVLFEQGRWRPARPEIYRRTIDFPLPFGRQAMARYGSGEIVTVPRHTGTSNVTSLITARSLVPHPALIPLFPYLRPAIALMRRTPARHLLGLAARLRRPTAPKEDAIAQPPRFAIAVLVRGRGGITANGVVEGGDFHQITAATLAFGAMHLASPSFDKRGALAPAMAVDAETLFRELSVQGISWRIERSDTTPRGR